MDRSILEKENTEYLADLWKSMSDLQPATAGQKGRGKSKFWDSRAKNYSRNVSNDRRDKSVAAVFNLMDIAGFDPKGKAVLDIGSGPGTFALPLARMGAKVTALDISSRMLQELEKKADLEGIDTIDTIHTSWNDADLDKMGSRKKFDMAFASMTPAICDIKAITKMMEASRAFCYYSGFLKRTWDPSYYDLYRELFKEEYRDFATGFHIPFMYLYSMGYSPVLKLNKDVWASDDTVDDMAQTLYDFFGQSKDTTPDMKETMKKYLSLKSTNGHYHAETNVFTGMMVWDIRSR